MKYISFSDMLTDCKSVVQCFGTDRLFITFAESDYINITSTHSNFPTHISYSSVQIIAK